MKKSFLTLLLIAVMLLACALPLAAADLKPVADLETNYQNAFDNTITYAKQGQSQVFNDAFLKSGAVGSTYGDWLAFGLGRGGVSDNNAGYLAALENYVTATYATEGGLDKNKTTEWQRIALTVLALGGDPRAFGTDKDGQSIDLIADGVYDPIVGNLWKQGLMGAVWGLIALDAKDYPTPAGAAYDRETIIAHLLETEISGGGFALNGSTPDPDVTAMVLVALSPYADTNSKAKAAIARGLTTLSSLQQKDGDFSSYGATNTESCVQVLVALCTLGIDPAKDSRFIKNGNSVLDGLMKYYNAADGGFIHAFTSDPANPNAVAGKTNAMATDQGRYAMVAYSRYLAGKSALYDFNEKAVTTTVSLRIEGIAANLLYDKNVTAQAGESVGALVERVLTAKGIPYSKNDYGYFSSINGEKEYTFNANYDGWLYRVNGETPLVAMTDYTLKGGETIELFYGPMDIAYPLLAVNGSAITVTYEYEDWSQTPVAKVKTPLAGATLTVGGKSFVTDDKGRVNTGLAAGSYPVALTKTDATKVVDGKALPLAVRLAADATVTIGSGSLDKLTDVVKGQWYYDDVAWVVEQGIMKGSSATRFGVNDTIRRCDFVTVLGRYEGIGDSSAAKPTESGFSDVPATAYYAAHVLWAGTNGIVNGTGAKSFSPNADISRQDMAVMIARYAKYAGIDLPAGTGSAKFADDGQIATYAKEAVYSMKAAGIINGKGGNSFDPKGSASRAEAAKIIHKLLTL